MNSNYMPYIMVLYTDVTILNEYSITVIDEDELSANGTLLKNSTMICNQFTLNDIPLIE